MRSGNADRALSRSFLNTGRAFRKVDAGYIPVLKRLLDRVRGRDDPYSVSTAYMAMTGRKDLWLFGEEGSFVLLARHPNNPMKLLLFPPYGGNRLACLEAVLSGAVSGLPQGSLDLARFSSQDQELRDCAIQNGWKNVPEDRLDWVFPVHILDTRLVARHEGAGFRDFRQNIHRAARNGLRAEAFDRARHRDSVMNLSRAWDLAKGHADLTDMLQSILSFEGAGLLPIKGLVVFARGTPVSFTFWEETRPVEGLANCLVNGAVGAPKGASEFTYLALCQALSQAGFSRVCIGGSETVSLDAFKRKMAPVQTVPLQTLRALELV